ncbi:hypothetical protein J6590_026920 [Homalodisca vitripennis]|nr:hypothetical protein J6590_026920 [Homalodisca vitripennis]
MRVYATAVARHGERSLNQPSYASPSPSLDNDNPLVLNCFNKTLELEKGRRLPGVKEACHKWKLVRKSNGVNIILGTLRGSGKDNAWSICSSSFPLFGSITRMKNLERK